MVHPGVTGSLVVVVQCDHRRVAQATGIQSLQVVTLHPRQRVVVLLLVLVMVVLLLWRRLMVRVMVMLGLLLLLLLLLLVVMVLLLLCMGQRLAERGFALVDVRVALLDVVCVVGVWVDVRLG